MRLTYKSVQQAFYSDNYGHIICVGSLIAGFYRLIDEETLYFDSGIDHQDSLPFLQNVQQRSCGGGD